MTTKIMLLMALVACDQASGVGDFVKNGGEEIAAAHGEIACLLYPEKCGDVYMCEMEADNALGHVEICIQRDMVLEDIEAAVGECKPTPRHVGLCYWHCDEGAGCNAFSGCWCPPPEAP